MSRALQMRLLAERYAVARLPAEAPVPGWVGGELTCVARTPAELSILCAEPSVPESVQANRGWRCFEVAGPLDFSEIGILAALTRTLAAVQISVFAVSTFDTDYLLVREDKLEAATAALKKAGHDLGSEPD